MSARAAGAESSASLAPGSALVVHLQSPDLEIHQPVRPLFWNGQETVEFFDCTLKPGAGETPLIQGTASITFNGLLIAQIEFHLRGGKTAEPAMAAVPQTAFRPRTAFASYASADRIDVMRCVQGIEKGSSDLDIFVDIDKLRSGDDWEEKLSTYIALSDVLYLFWSKAASESVWVDREWRTGLRLKTLSFIDPCPLESPELVPPPQELRRLHFDDRYLRQIYAQKYINELKANRPTQV